MYFAGCACISIHIVSRAKAPTETENQYLLSTYRLRPCLNFKIIISLSTQIKIDQVDDVISAYICCHICLIISVIDTN